MPIKVTCQCGKSFAAKDELAGRAVKCPNCQQALRIPAAAPAPSSSGSSVLHGGPARPGGPSESMFDDVGLKAAPAGAMRCPGCGSPLAPNAVLCVTCGYNLKLGRRMETVRMGAGGVAGGHGGHDEVTGTLMNRAAQTIEEDKEEERKKTKEGAPWWVFLIGLIFVIGFIVMMMFLPQNIAVQVGGWCVVTIGTILCFYSYIRVIMIAFQESMAMGLMTLLLGGCGWLVYCIMRWDRCGGYFLMYWGGGIIQTAGFGAVAFSTMLEGEGEAYRRPPFPAVQIVSVQDVPASPQAHIA